MVFRWASVLMLLFYAEHICKTGDDEAENHMLATLMFRRGRPATGRVYRKISRHSAVVISLLLSGCATYGAAPSPVAAPPSPDARANAMIELGRSAQQRGDLSSALTFYQSARTLDPQLSTPILDEGVIAEQQGHFERAQILLSAYVKRNPGDREAATDLGIADLATGDAKAANKILSLIATTSANTRVLRNEAVALAFLGQSRAALAMVRRASAIDPTDPVLLANLALMLAADGQPGQAERAIDHALALPHPPRFVVADAIMVLAYAGKSAKAEQISAQMFGSGGTSRLMARAAHARQAQSFSDRAKAFGLVTVPSRSSPPPQAVVPPKSR